MTDLLKAHTMSRALAEDLAAAFYLDSASQPMHRKEKLALAERHLRETAEALGYRVEKVESPAMAYLSPETTSMIMQGRLKFNGRPS